MSRFPTISALIVLGALGLGGCGSSTAPVTGTLTAVSPTPSATAVNPLTGLMLTFGQPMMAGMEQYVDLHLGGIGGPTVPMSCAWNPNRTTLTCTPAAPLAAGTQYTIHVGAGMLDDHGELTDLDHWTTMGGQWASSGMMGGTHAGQPISMMGSGWRQGRHYGMAFLFTTS